MYSDLSEVKTMLDLDPKDTIEDKKLLLLLERASSWIEEVLGRSLELKRRTEFYCGTGTQQLWLRNRPVHRNTQHTLEVYEDENGNFGSTAKSFDSITSLLEYGEDYALDVDGDDGTSRSGVLVRINDAWPRPPVRERGLLSSFIGQGFGNVKVVYTAGYVADTMPGIVRDACNSLVARMRLVYPLGAALNSDSYEQRSVSYAAVDDAKTFLIGPTIRQLVNFRSTWFAAR